jgi:hypothetical protein
MHSYHHILCTKLLKFVLLILLIKTFPHYVYVDKGRILQIFEIGLNQFGVYLPKFQIKNTEKRKGKRSEK